MAASIDYYDILLLGMTGMGKSTVGNKILDASPTDGTNIRNFTSWIHHPGEEASKCFFQTDEHQGARQNASSVTQEPKILSNETVFGNRFKLRVVDTPGFVGHSARNLQIMQSIMCVQAEFRIAFQRILYFLPQRGPLEKADQVLQEELKVMHRCYGKEIFSSMILVGTNRKKVQTKKFDDEDIRTTQSVFEVAIERATGQTIPSPPVIYIGFSSDQYPKDKVFSDILAAKVVIKEGMLLQVREDKCANCDSKIHSKIQVANYQTMQKGFSVTNSEGEMLYDNSKCHPGFQSKHYLATKIIGGIAYIATFGLLYVIQKVLGIRELPWFTNSQMICVHCEKARNIPGCHPVKQMYKGAVVDHTNGNF